MSFFPNFILQRKFLILTAIGLLTLILGFFSFRIQLNQNPDELIFKDDPEYPLLKIFFEEFGYDEIVVAVYSADNVLNIKHLEAIVRITDELEQLHGVDKVVSIANARDVVTHNDLIDIVPFVNKMPETLAEQELLRLRIEENPIYNDLIISSDSKIALFDITIDPSLTNEERNEILKCIERIFSKHSKDSKYYFAGSPVGRAEIFRCVRRDFSTLLPIGLLLLLVSMYIIFRNYLCVLLPIMSVTLSVVWTIGFMYLVGSELNFLSVLIPTILLIIGTSDCIHILSQYQDCRYTCNTKKKALQSTIQSMFLPCFLTTLTTMVGFSSLAVCRILPLKNFGIFGAIGIGFTFLVSITLIPIGLSIWDTKSLSLHKPPSEVFLVFLDRITPFVSSKKLTVLVICALLIIFGSYGATKLHVETDPGKFFGNKIKVVSDMLYIEKQIGGFIPIYIIIDGQEKDSIKDPTLLRKIDELSEHIRTKDGVDKVISIADLIKYINYRVNDNDLSYHTIPDDKKKVAELLLMASFSDEAEIIHNFVNDSFSKSPINIRFRYHDFYSFENLLKPLRPLLNKQFDYNDSIRTYVTGTNAMLANTLVPILTGLKQSLFIAALAIFTLMIIIFRSIRFALISMIPNLLPIVLTLGAMGLFGISLNFSTAPIAAIALGIAIDDTIHFLARFRIEFRKEQNYSKAVYNTILSVGKPILITSIVLTAGFCIFLFSNFQPTQNMGILISFTVISAVFADLILLPVLLLLFKPLGKEKPAIA